ncbi:MAG: MobA [Hyphomicrobiales bacterium]|nr:MobA [Hyphomicrobiales bacterium]
MLSPDATSPAVAAVILAGGIGERLGGVCKATLRIGGRRLLDRVADAVVMQVSAVLVAYGRQDPARLALRPLMTPMADLGAEGSGPMGGIAAAVAWCRNQPAPPRFLLSVAVDTPFFPADFARKALAAIASDVDAVIAAHAGQAYPTNALWRLASLAALPERTLAGTAPPSPKRLAAELRSVLLEWPEQAGGDPFANLNVPADLLALGRRAG